MADVARQAPAEQQENAMADRKVVVLEELEGGGVRADGSGGFLDFATDSGAIRLDLTAQSVLPLAAQLLHLDSVAYRQRGNSGPRSILAAQEGAAGIVHQRSDVLSLTLRLEGQNEVPFHLPSKAAGDLARNILALLEGEDDGGTDQTPGSERERSRH